MPKFAIVEFLTDKSVAVVATSWLIDDGETTLCFCPPIGQMTNAVMRCVKVDPRWKAYECRQLYSTDDYSKARLKLRESEETSNLESEVDMSHKSECKRRRRTSPKDALRNKSEVLSAVFRPTVPIEWSATRRIVIIIVGLSVDGCTVASTVIIGYRSWYQWKDHIKRRRPQYESDEIESDVEPVEVADGHGQSNVLPKMSKVTSKSETRAASIPAPAPPPPPPPPVSQPQMYCTSVPSIGCQSDSSCSVTAFPVCTTPSSSNKFRTTGAVSAIEKCILMKLEDMRESLLDVKKAQTFMITKIDSLMRATGLFSTSEELPTDIDFPLNSVLELSALEKKLEDHTLKYSVIRNISTIGGSSVKECTRRILRHVLTNSCAISLNWKGRGGKVAFAETLLRTVITKAVRMNPLTSKATDVDVELHMKEWLKFAKERAGRRKERDAKRKNKLTTDKRKRQTTRSERGSSDEQPPPLICNQHQTFDSHDSSSSNSPATPLDLESIEQN